MHFIQVAIILGATNFSSGCHPLKSQEKSATASKPIGALALEDLIRKPDGLFEIKCLDKDVRQVATHRQIVNNMICMTDPEVATKLSSSEIEDVKKLKIQPTYTNEWDQNWSAIVADAILSDAPQLINANYLGKSEIHNYCPNFSNLRRVDKIKFWVIVFSSIARFESAFNTKMRYEERKNFWSEGLLQLSYGDEKQHPDCKISLAQRNIFDPQINLHCGVVIMRSQILKAKYGKIYTHGYFYYWSVLRNKIAAIDTEIKKHINQIAGCKT